MFSHVMARSKASWNILVFSVMRKKMKKKKKNIGYVCRFGLKMVPTLANELLRVLLAGLEFESFFVFLEYCKYMTNEFWDLRM